jgi:hypothetical protein
MSTAREQGAAQGQKTRAENAAFKKLFDVINPNEEGDENKLQTGFRYVFYRKTNRKAEWDKGTAIKLLGTYNGGEPIEQDGRTYYPFVAVRPPYDTSKVGHWKPADAVALIPKKFADTAEGRDDPAKPPLTKSYSHVYMRPSTLSWQTLTGQYRMTEDAARKAPPPELKEWQKRVVYLSPDDWFIGKLKSEGVARLLPSSIPENAALRIQQLVGTATGTPIGELDPAQRVLGGKRRYRGGDEERDVLAATLAVDEAFEAAAAALPNDDSSGGQRRRTSRRKSKSRRTIRRRTFS